MRPLPLNGEAKASGTANLRLLMGYNLYITRDRGWFDRGKAPIERSLWDAVVAADPSLAVSSEDWFERKCDMGASERTERLYAVLWIEHPERVAFWFVD